MITLSIIILSYNTKELTLRCIHSIIGQYQKELDDKILEIIVVDNNSTDGSRNMIEEEFLSRHSGKRRRSASRIRPALRDSGQARMTKDAQIILIQNKENVGFAKGCNIGAKTAKGKYILFLNSDTQVFDRGFFKMVKFLDENKKVGVLGGKLLNSDGTSQRSGGKFYSLWNLLLTLIGFEVFVRKEALKIEKTDWVSGACMMIKKDLFNELSGFDEHFFMYIEDMELCFRVNMLGLASYFYPDINLKHKTLGSSDKSFAIINIYKGILYFYSKHKSYPEYNIAKIFLISKAIIGIILGIVSLDVNLVNRYKKALSFCL